MKFFLKAKPNAKEDEIEKIDENHFAVSTKEPPVNGRANQAILRILADYFDVSPSQIKIISGLTSKNKIIEII